MSDERLECDVVVVGAGVIGLAVSARLSEKHSVVVIEPYGKFGQETSSRNSEVVHSGIYYPPGSKKTEWCVRGRDLLYSFCEKFGVPVNRCGKFVVACEESEEAYLEKLFAHCKTLDVPAERRGGADVKQNEPLINVRTAVFLPITGVVDSHVYMQVLENQATERGASIAYRNRFVGARKQGQRWISEIDGGEGTFEVDSAFIVNCAGLAAAEVSSKVLGNSRYEHRYCRGRYFSLSSKFREKFHHLIYPVPPKDGLGVHITIDLAGEARLGPDVDWCQSSDYATVNKHYDCDWDTIRASFVSASQRYCPSIEAKDLSPGLIGIRPKLFIDGKASPDFLIENHGGFIHTLGIESPGLTSSLAISDEVAKLL